MTRELSSESSTWGVGTEGETGIADGLLGRSTIFIFLFFLSSTEWGLIWFGWRNLLVWRFELEGEEEAECVD